MNVRRSTREPPSAAPYALSRHRSASACVVCVQRLDSSSAGRPTRTRPSARRLLVRQSLLPEVAKSARARNVRNMRIEVDEGRTQPPSPRTPLRVLVVGQGPPARGGIPSFLSLLLDDPTLRRDVDLALMNTTRTEQHPAAATLANATAALRDAVTLRRRARRADVVHLNVAPAPLLPLLRTCLLASAARSAGVGVIVHAHSGRLQIAARRVSYRLALKALVRIVDAVAVVSTDGGDVIRRVGGTAWLIRNGVDAARFMPGERSVAPPVILTFVGTVCERKGLDDLRLALVALKTEGAIDERLARVVIVGDARQEGPGVFERVRRAFETADLPMVEFAGSQPPDRVARLLAETDVFCLPSHWEGLPISLLEAMAAGAAVIATSVGEIPAVLAEGSGIVVAPHDPDGLADAIRRLLRDPAERARLGRAAQERVLREFGRRHVADEVAELYRQVASRRSRYSM
jgi:glycosyltransferase involved in cell wall biosynthesis